MKTRKIIVSILVLALLLGFSVGMVEAQAGTGTGETTTPEGGPPLNDTFTYQGSLIVNGVPANGLYDFQAMIYDWSSAGTLIATCDSALLGNITVTKGLFTFVCSPTGFAAGYSLDSVFNGQTRYLEVLVAPDGGGAPTTLPRQSITPTPYAWTLRPGAQITGTLSGIGDAIFTAQAGLVGGGGSFGGSFGQNLLFIAAGLYAHTDFAYGSAVFASDSNSDGLSWGVYATSASNEGYGVYTVNTAAAGETYGIYAEDQSTGGYAGYFVNTNNVTDGVATALYASRPNYYGIAISGDHTGATGTAVYGDADGGYGLYGHTLTGSSAVYGDTGAASHNYGLYTGDNLYSSNFHSKGAIMQVVQNAGSQPLQPGDVVVFVGINLEGDEPVIQVALADAANSTAVAGVVYSRYRLGDGNTNPEAPGIGPDTIEGAAQPGEYLLVVVQGPAQVRASALGGAIQPGDLLSSAAQPGLAGAAAQITIQGVTFTPDGTVFAKALEALDSGEALIYVYVTLE